MAANKAFVFEGDFRAERGPRAGRFRQRQNIIVAPSDFGELRQMTYQTFTMALRQEQTEGDLLDPVFVVDGKFNGDPLAVRTRIEAVDFAQTSVEEVISFAYEQIVRRSPVLTGRYLASHTILQNGRVITDLDQLRLDSATDKIEIANPQPYAKKLEQGLSNQAAGGIYRLAAVRTQNVYRRLVRVKFTYRPLSRLGNILTGMGSPQARKPDTVLRRIGKRGETLTRPISVTHVYPVIQIWAQASNRKSSRPARKSHATRRYSHKVARLPPYRPKRAFPG